MPDTSSSSPRKPPPIPVVKDWPDNDEALLELKAEGQASLPENFWCLKDAFEGTQIFGGTGSGKSSGSGQAIARAFMAANMGGLVLTAKKDEVLSWRNYAKATNREADLIVVEPGSRYGFDFLRYEMQRPGAGAGHTENLVNLFCSVLEASERKGGSGGGDKYWERAVKQLLRNAIDLSILAVDRVDLPSLYRIVTSAPRSLEQTESETWQSKSLCHGLMEFARGRSKELGRESDFELTENYWLSEFPSLAHETRSSIVSMFTTMADCFLRGLLRKLFCNELNFSPEDTFNGRIIILNLPVKEYNELGQFSQVLFKFCWQRAVERRIPPGIDTAAAERTIRPVFLWADESQFFVNSYDALFQSTARSSRACTVYLTQNLPSYLAAFGGHNSKAESETFLGNLQTKIFHANGDPSTNQWAANSIGKIRQLQVSSNLSDTYAQSGGLSRGQQGTGASFAYEYPVQPQEFTMLRTGGTESNLQVEAVLFQGGRRWISHNRDNRTAANYIRHVFPQVYREEKQK